MTNRESQIFQWIVEDPMISQEELAKKAGIKRSSVAVHISNLMRKGYIQGKGYIINTPSYCSVVGGVNIDIGGAPFDKLIAQDSNPGTVTMSLGGVGRNIAHNMSLLGLNVKLITAIGEDSNAHKIIDSCAQLNIDISDSLRTNKDATSTYLFIADDEGDMELAISDMNIYRYLTPEYMAGKMDILNHGQMIVLDTNIPEETISYILTNSTVPVFADPVSCKKAPKLLPMLGKLHTVAPNRLEAEILSGISIDSEESLKRAADIMLDAGVEQVFITLGSDGIFAADAEASIHLPNFDSHLVNATGAGDAFMAGLALANAKGLSLKESALTGLAAASIAVESISTINDNMCVEAVFAKAGIHPADAAETEEDE